MAPSLDDLVNQSLSGIIQSGGLPLEEQLFQRQQAAVKPSVYARGLGISSVMQSALAKARVDAPLAAQNAQLSALGQAAAITQQNANRQQQATQFGQTMNQRNKELGQQKDLADETSLRRGVATGVGAATQLGGLVFAPEIRRGIRSTFGLDKPDGTPSDAPISAAGLPSASAFDESQAMGLGGGGGLPDLSGGLPSIGSNFSLPDFSSYIEPSYATPQFDFSGGFDLSALYDSTIPQFKPYELGSYY